MNATWPPDEVIVWPGSGLRQGAKQFWGGEQPGLEFEHEDGRVQYERAVGQFLTDILAVVAQSAQGRAPALIHVQFDFRSHSRPA